MFPHFDVSKAIGLATSSRDYASTLNIRKSSPRFTQFLDSLEGTSTWNYILRDRYKTMNCNWKNMLYFKISSGI